MILISDVDGVMADDGVAFQAYVDSRVLSPSGELSPLGYVREGHIVAKPAASTTIRLRLTADYDRTPATSDVDLTPEGTETAVLPMFESMQEADITVAQVRIGDASAVASYWALVLLVLPSYVEGER